MYIYVCICMYIYIYIYIYVYIYYEFVQNLENTKHCIKRHLALLENCFSCKIPSADFLHSLE